VAFDVEIVFIYIWALNFKVLLIDGLVSMAVFIGVLLIGLAYAWRKGVLSWR
jgi:NADH-quinone oxidoreductase subunit A